jgi:hypothetical protein
MRTRRIHLVSLLTVSLAIVPIDSLPAQQKPKELQWTHAFDLSCRPYGKANFEKDTPKFGVEAFRDNNNGLGLYISQAGSIAVAGGFQELKIPLTSKGPDWTTGLDLPARDAGVKEFRKDTKVHSMEIFRDPNTANWLFITEKGNLAATAAKRPAAGGNHAPKWIHSVDLRVRKAGLPDWNVALKYGIEVYRDANSGNLVYICQTGQIAIVPDTPAAPPPTGDKGTEGKAPEWLHGLDLACRKYNEPSFGKDTRKFGVEIFRDENNGNLMFIAETGSLAVTGGNPALKAPTPKVSEPTWKHGLNVKCRAFGEKEFSEKTRIFGIEVFRDDNVAATIYVNEIGNIAVMR